MYRKGAALLAARFCQSTHRSSDIALSSRWSCLRRSGPSSGWVRCSTLERFSPSATASAPVKSAWFTSLAASATLREAQQPALGLAARRRAPFGWVTLAAMLSGETPAGQATTMVLAVSVYSLGAAIGGAAGGLLLAWGGYAALGVGLAAFAAAAVVSVRQPAAGERSVPPRSEAD
jgi:hypothetical protein